MSDAGRQHVHRQQNNGQDDHAAKGGPNPGFRGLVHAVAASMKRRGSRYMRFLGHRIRPLVSSSYGDCASYKTLENAGMEMPFVYKNDSSNVCLLKQSVGTWKIGSLIGK